MVSYFTIIITTVVSHYSADEISKCFLYIIPICTIFVTKLYRKCLNTFVSHCTYVHVCVNTTCTRVRFSDI